MAAEGGRAATGNQLLTALPAKDYQRLVSSLEPVALGRGEVLYESGVPIRYAYFPHAGVVSLLSVLPGGPRVEAAAVGREGMVGLPVYLGSRSTFGEAVVQVEGVGLRARAEVFESILAGSDALRAFLSRYTHALLVQACVSVACAYFHTVEERYARRLLTLYDMAGLDELPFTQEFSSRMLSVRRSGISVAASDLQNAGIISYTRGKVRVLDRARLEAAACECYRVVRDELDRLPR